MDNNDRINKIILIGLVMIVIAVVSGIIINTELSKLGLSEEQLNTAKLIIYPVIALVFAVSVSIQIKHVYKNRTGIDNEAK